MVNCCGDRYIVSLKPASRALRQFPLSLWYPLVREELPWLCEAWDENVCDYIPLIWTAITAQETKNIRTRELYNEVLRREYKSGELDPAVFDILVPPWPPTVPHRIKLPRGKTNWFEFYSAITRNWNKLKGLKNCWQIWKDVEEIIRRIRKYQG